MSKVWLTTSRGSFLLGTPQSDPSHKKSSKDADIGQLEVAAATGLARFFILVCFPFQPSFGGSLKNCASWFPAFLKDSLYQQGSGEAILRASRPFGASIINSNNLES
jgi:hypothetical protein